MHLISHAALRRMYNPSTNRPNAIQAATRGLKIHSSTPPSVLIISILRYPSKEVKDGYTSPRSVCAVYATIQESKASQELSPFVTYAGTLYREVPVYRGKYLSIVKHLSLVKHILSREVPFHCEREHPVLQVCHFPQLKQSQSSKSLRYSMNRCRPSIGRHLDDARV
jgi:hypothetical protein